MRLRSFPAQILSFAVALCAVTLPFAGCGGKTPLAQSSTQNPAVTAVNVSCNPSGVTNGGTAQCTAAVQGTGSYSPTVTWSASAGSISSSGVLTAPASSGTVTVTATSTQQPDLSGSTVVSVASTGTPSSITSVSVSCNPAIVSTGGAAQCTASVTGSGTYSSNVTWTTSGGSISSSGTLTAPAAAGNVTVSATSTQDASKSGEATIAVQPAAPSRHHVVMVMEENDSYSSVIGDSAWPNLNKLAANGALPTHYYADTHPSIGNYLMLTTGQVLTNDDNSTQVWNVDNIARRMLSQGVSFRVYAEGISQGYVGGNTGNYLVRHNPFALLSDVADNTNVADAVIYPFSQFAIDAASGKLPEFSFIVPDVMDDAHNGTPQQADSWLQSQVVAPLSNTAAFKSGGDGLLVIDFDEAATSDTSYGGGHVSPVLWGPIVKPGYQQSSSTVYQHQSMLRTIMELLGLQNPPSSAASAPLMTEFFQ